MSNPLVRKAISAAIDRRLIVDLILKGGATPATTFTPPSIVGSVAPEENIRYPLQSRSGTEMAGGSRLSRWQQFSRYYHDAPGIGKS
ncbi:MAG: hypothetical protein HC887_01780 [Desulfobacteraceae bacterium]|nr:hypothetical protein [Desulfobacteraceae bacterium]